jgi:hypothetical protein
MYNEQSGNVLSSANWRPYTRNFRRRHHSLFTPIHWLDAPLQPQKRTQNPAASRESIGLYVDVVPKKCLVMKAKHVITHYALLDSARQVTSDLWQILPPPTQSGQVDQPLRLSNPSYHRRLSQTGSPVHPGLCIVPAMCSWWHRADGIPSVMTFAVRKLTGERARVESLS